MLRAKFRVDPLKTVAVHKEQKTHTDTHIRFSVYKIHTYFEFIIAYCPENSPEIGRL